MSSLLLRMVWKRGPPSSSLRGHIECRQGSFSKEVEVTEENKNESSLMKIKEDSVDFRWKECGISLKKRRKMKMNKIKSFCVDHDCLEKGMYISRIDCDGGYLMIYVW